MSPKIAIYSGVIPSTTFIENLIQAVAAEGRVIYLFGYLKKHIAYSNPRIRICTYPRNKWKLIPYVFYNQLRLLFISGDRFSILKQHINSKGLQSKSRLVLWLKYLPVVINLPDIFHIQWARNLDEWMFLKDLYGVKIVLSLRGTQVKYAPLASIELATLYRKNFPRIDGFHAVSKDIAETAWGYGADPGKTRVIYTGIQLDLMKQFECKPTFQAGNELKLISVGRMKWIKGYQLALDAIYKLREKGLKLHYTIIAGGDPEEILYQVKDLDLNSIITIIPGIAQKEVFRSMQESDVLLLTSFDEGIANVALEAMALGLPVLSSDCGGMPEVIENNRNGYLFRNRDVDDLCEKIMVIANDSFENKTRICENAKEFVNQNHSMELLGKQMNEFYLDILKPYLLK